MARSAFPTSLIKGYDKLFPVRATGHNGFQGIGRDRFVTGIALSHHMLQQMFPDEVIRTIEVGSGTGYMKYFYSDPSILIDPNPSVYPYCPSDLTSHMPDFPLLDDYMRSRPAAASDHNILVLNWPYYDSGPYDYDAVMTLQPDIVVALTEGGGAAGSDELRAFLENPEDSNYHTIINKYVVKRSYGDNLYVCLNVVVNTTKVPIGEFLRLFNRYDLSLFEES